MQGVLTPEEDLWLLREGRIGAIYVKTHHGLLLDQAGIEYLSRYRAAWRSHGIAVWHFGWMTTENPVLQARAAVNIGREHDLDGYVHNAEMEVEGGHHFPLHAAWLAEFRRIAPYAPLLLSHLGAAWAPWVRELPWGAYQDAGAYFGPQIYPNEYGEVYSFSNCWAHAERARIAPDRIIPSLGTYGDYWTDGSMESYIAGMRTYGTRGFSLFRGDTPNDDTYRLLGRYIANGELADYYGR